MQLTQNALIQIDRLFTYHPPKFGQPERYAAIRDAAKAFALVLAANCPDGPDTNYAIVKVRESVMMANAAIALE